MYCQYIYSYYLSFTMTGEAKAWHYPPEVKFADEDFDEEDLRVRVLDVYISHAFEIILYVIMCIKLIQLYIQLLCLITVILFSIWTLDAG